MDEKRPYTTPQLAEYGALAEITQQGGASFTDVDQGTCVCGNIGNVAGS